MVVVLLLLLLLLWLSYKGQHSRTEQCEGGDRTEALINFDEKEEEEEKEGGAALIYGLSWDPRARCCLNVQTAAAQYRVR
jgi:hypothetical protein